MSQLGERIVLAVDPGSSKCGLAIVKRSASGKIDLVWRKIVATEIVCDELKEAHTIAPYNLLIVGSGTTSKSLVARLRDEMPGVGILVVDEKDTSMQARERYWVHHPRRGWRRLLPATMQVPPEPIDDFAALILAERVLNE